MGGAIQLTVFGWELILNNNIICIFSEKINLFQLNKYNQLQERSSILVSSFNFLVNYLRLFLTKIINFHDMSRVFSTIYQPQLNTHQSRFISLPAICTCPMIYRPRNLGKPQNRPHIIIITTRQRMCVYLFKGGGPMWTLPMIYWTSHYRDPDTQLWPHPKYGTFRNTVTPPALGPSHVQTCSTFTWQYFKLVHCEAHTNGKRTVRLLLECFLVVAVIIFIIIIIVIVIIIIIIGAVSAE